MKNLLLISVILLQSWAMAFSAIKEDQPSLQIQYDAINNNEYVVSNNVIIKLRDLSIKALIDWCQELTNLRRNTTIFYKPTQVLAIGIDPDIPMSQQLIDIERQSALFEKEHPFSDFPLYDCVDIKKLLSEPSNLFQVGINMDDMHQINVSIKAILPVESQNSTAEYKFDTVSFDYLYSLDILGKDESPNQRHYLVGKLKESIDSFYLKNYKERTENYPRAFLKQFKWKLIKIKCTRNLKSVRLKESDLPTNINDLFNQL